MDFPVRVNVKLPTVEVRYKNLFVDAKCEVVHGKPLPTLWNSLMSLLSVIRPFSHLIVEMSCPLSCSTFKSWMKEIKCCYQQKELQLMPNNFIENLSIGQVFMKVNWCDSQEAKISILKDVNGIIKPSRYAKYMFCWIAQSIKLKWLEFDAPI